MYGVSVEWEKNKKNEEKERNLLEKEGKGGDEKMPHASQAYRYTRQIQYTHHCGNKFDPSSGQRV